MTFHKLAFQKFPLKVFRDYQELAIQQLFESIKRGEKPVLCLPTGTGKTVVILEFFRRLFYSGYLKNKTRRFLVAVPFTELVQRFRKDAVAFGIEPFIEVQTYSYLIRHYEKYDPKQFYMMVVDECHHVKANGLSNVFEYFSNQKQFGASATPKRLDGLPLNPPFNYVIQPYPDQWYEDHGYISPIRIFQKPLAELDLTGDDDDLSMQNDLLDKPVIYGNVIENWELYCYGIPTLGFVPSVNFGKKITQSFNDQYRHIFNRDISVFLDSKTPKQLRKDSIEAVIDGKYLVPFNVALFIEGLDIPIIKALLMLRKTASKSIYKQMIGRIRRPTGETGIMLDFVGNFLLHNHPNLLEVYDLKGDKEKFEKGEIPTICPDCNIDLIRSTDKLFCLSCGYFFKIKPQKTRGIRKNPVEVDGILEEYKQHPSSNMVASFIDKWEKVVKKKNWSMVWGIARAKEVLRSYPDVPDQLLVTLLTTVGYNVSVSINLIAQLRLQMEYEV